MSAAVTQRLSISTASNNRTDNDEGGEMAPKLKRSEIVRPALLIAALAALIVLLVAIQTLNA